MNFDEPRDVESIYYDLKLADYPRSLNRALIDKLFGGQPPFTAEEAAENNITVNVNDLTGTKIAHDARMQFNSAFLRPGNFFRAHTDTGAIHRREKWNGIVTKEINKPMKRSLDYFETFRSKFALCVLHGIGPGSWDTSDFWCPEAKAITDVLLPSNTLLTMKNLPFFVIYRSYTAPELMKLTSGPKVDKAWNMGLVKRLLEWLDEESRTLLGTTWPEVWSPEKMQERIKGDGAYYASDRVPTIDVYDFYYYSDEEDATGWRRRMILDSWSTPSMVGGKPKMDRNKKLEFAAGEFLYDSGSRKVADSRQELISFQFADLSAVAPFRYHSVRSLGFLLWAQCHLLNRLRCKFNEAVFESLMMYFRVKSMDDVQRALKLELITRGFIDESVQFVPPEQRWQVNANLAELGLTQNQQLIERHSASYVQNQEMSQGVEKTKFQVMAEVNAMTTLISAALQQAYAYQNFEYREIFRRFCKPNSKDPDVRNFRARCLSQGVPEKVLVAEAWEIEAERVMGAGNKTLEMAITDQLMEWRPLYDPEAQREILRQATFNVTDDAARAEALVPDQPHISDSIHDTELAWGSLMQGSAVTPKPGLNAVEVCSTMMRLMGGKIQQITQSGGVGTPQDLLGLQLAEQYTKAFVGILAQDPESVSIVKKIGDALGKLMNMVKAFAQRQQEMMEKAQQNGQGMDPADVQKLQFEAAKNKIKLDSQTKSHAQRLAQRAIQFETEQQRADREHALNIKQSTREHQAEIHKKDLEGAANINRERARGLAEAEVAAAEDKSEPAAE